MNKLRTQEKPAPEFKETVDKFGKKHEQDIKSIKFSQNGKGVAITLMVDATFDTSTLAIMFSSPLITQHTSGMCVENGDMVIVVWKYDNMV